VVTVSPATASVVSGGKQQFTATVSGTSNVGVTWSASAGTVSNSGLFTAPTVTVATTVAATATSLYDPTKTASAAVTVQPTGNPLPPPSAGCGPPDYGCSYSGTNVIQAPPAPDVSAGVNTIVYDTSFPSQNRNPIVRLTGPTLSTLSCNSAQSRSENQNIFSPDDTLIAINCVGGQHFVLWFDPQTMQVAPTPVFRFVGSFTFGRSANTLYYMNDATASGDGSILTKVTFSPGVWPSTPPKASAPVAIIDLAGPNCANLPSKYTWHAMLGNTGDDTTFGTAFSISGNQDTGTYAVAYKIGAGCSVYHTDTALVNGAWGQNGAASDSCTYKLHNSVMYPGGVQTVSKANNGAINCTHPVSVMFFWQTGTNSTPTCPPGANCSGHATFGYSHFVNGTQLNFWYRSVSNLGTYQDIFAAAPKTTSTPPLTQHVGWSNVDPNDSNAFFVTTVIDTTLVPVFPTAGYNEILAYFPPNNPQTQTWRRLTHTFATGSRAIDFHARNAIGSVSQSGNFFAWTSDWLLTLGTDSAGAPRTDVFIVRAQ
jgi:hypothetical protein